MLLEEEFLSVGGAVCTYVMRRFTAAHGWFYRISHDVRGKSYEFIPLYLGVACIKLSHTFFKRAYFFNQLRLSRIGRKCALLGGKNLSLQFPERIPKFEKVSDLYQFLNALSRRIQGGHNGV